MALSKEFIEAHKRFLASQENGTMRREDLVTYGRAVVRERDVQEGALRAAEEEHKYAIATLRERHAAIVEVLGLMPMPDHGEHNDD